MPEEAWSGRKPSVEHFRIFGCVGHVHIPDVKKTKLDDKSVKCVLLGFSSESKAYKMFDPIEKKVHISRDLVFEEDKKCKWEVDYFTEHSMELEWENDYEHDVNEEVGEEEEGENMDHMPQQPNNQ